VESNFQVEIQFSNMIFIIFALTVVIATTLAVVLPSHTLNIFRATGSSNGRLSFTPTRLSGIDVIVLAVLVIFKYINSLIGSHPAFKPTSDGKGFAIPWLTLSAPLHVDKSDIERFNIAIEKKQNEVKDVKSSPLLLPAVTTPLLLIMLSNRSCPVLPFGAVNTKNRFEFLDPAACRAVTCLKDAIVTGHLGGDSLVGRRVKRGMEFEIVIEVEGKMDKPPARRVIFRQVIGIMVFLPKSTKPAWESKQDIADTRNPMRIPEAPPQQIELSSNAPMKWAAVCKDLNPIHMSSLAAKLFGFPGKIAHGNHVVAHVVEKQRNVDPVKYPARGLFWQLEKPWFLSVEFKRPMVLPLALDIKFAVECDEANQSKFEFEVMRGEKVHITGAYGEP
jgi:acyl dehydratase